MYSVLSMVILMLFFTGSFASVRTAGLSLYKTHHTAAQRSLEHEDISRLIKQELLLNSESHTHGYVPEIF